MSKGDRAKKARLPRLVVFDLDGCLWRPELFEIATSPIDPNGSPFTLNSHDTIPGTKVKSTNGYRKVELIGDTRKILHELFYDEMWYPSLVGISSRTHPPGWAREILSLFLVFDESRDELPPVAMKDIFTPEICILDRDMDKATQFKLLVDRANAILPAGDRIQYKDAIFFDNEAGNCKQVAQLGVSTVYTPKGLTQEAWENGLSSFPYSRGVLGPKLPYKKMDSNHTYGTSQFAMTSHRV